MEAKRGMIFRNLEGTKCVVANVFKEGDSDDSDEVVTYRYWIKHKKRWRFETNFKVIFLIAFNYGWKWEK